ncbi:hypothetical protein D3C86_1498180 [compost metagenome]
MLRQQWHQTAGANVRCCRHGRQLAEHAPAQHGVGLQLFFVGDKGRRHILLHRLVALLEPPWHGLAGGAQAKDAAAVLGQLVYAIRRTVAFQIARRGADNQLQGKQPARDHALGRRKPDAKTHIGAVFDPVADAVVQLHIRLHTRVDFAEILQKRGQHRPKNRVRADNAQRPGNVVGGVARLRQCALQPGKGRARRFQELPPLGRQLHVARGAMQQPHA